MVSKIQMSTLRICLKMAAFYLTLTPTGIGACMVSDDSVWILNPSSCAGAKELSKKVGNHIAT